MGWIEYGKTWHEFRGWDPVKLRTYAENSLAQPGTVIEVDDCNYLIGDINKSGGVCNCCAEIRDDDIVTRYKTVWTVWTP